VDLVNLKASIVVVCTSRSVDNIRFGTGVEATSHTNIACMWGLVPFLSSLRLCVCVVEVLCG
jgi:hypothetical protein